ncbi:hypothetical protein ABIA33_000781 [Streptacidiphilus sp. MAP12-16]|uniref:TraM recognition domain-containing protein n=1 Tax=Streptacidiphilus sp. MAP12-16 TaxID=3156300 RepID=UPI003515A54C
MSPMSLPRSTPPNLPPQSGRAGQQPPPSRGIPDGAIVGLLGTLLGATTLVWLSTALGGLVTHGHLPHPLPFAGTPTAIRTLATAPNGLTAAWPGTPAAELPSPLAFWTTFFVLLSLLIALALTVLTAWVRIRTARGAAERARAGGDERHREHFRTAEPDPFPAPRTAPRTPAAPVFFEPLDDDPSTVPVAPAGTGINTPTDADTGPPVVVVAPPTAAQRTVARFAFPAGMTSLLVPDPAATTAKRRLLQRVIAAATGPVLVVTDDLALWEDRPAHRDARLFDPLRLVDEVTDPETRVRWAPHDRCEDPATATARARALLAPTARSGTSQAEKGIQGTAQTLLRCWLHAAALDQRPFRHVHRWASGTARHEAVAILRTADPHTAADGWGGELQALLTQPTELRESALDRILSALDALSELQVQQACTPSTGTDTLDVESVIRNRGTLYLLGRATETRVSRPDPEGPTASGSDGSGAPARRSAMPLLTALVEDVVERGRRMAVRSSSGRLDPPLLCVLDNVAAVAPFPGLPELVARGGPLGLGGVAVFRSPEQARLRWDERAVHSLWTDADARALLGPLTDQDIQSLLGALHTSATEIAAAASPGPLTSDDLLLLTARRPAQRFRIGNAEAANPPVPSGSRPAQQP